MANNNVLFNAAYKGAVGGLTSRWVAPSMVGSDSVNAALASAVAFATMLDSLIATGSYTDEQGQFLTSLCESVWDDRMPVSDVPSTYGEVAGTIKSLFESGNANLLPVAGGGTGAIAKYTVGPTWTGAEFQTIQAAIDQAVEDGHSGSTAGDIVEFVLYPGRYSDAVVIPTTLPRWVLTGSGADNGSEIIGSFTANLPSSNGEFAISGIGFGGAFNLTQVGGTGASIIGRIFDSSFQATTFSTQTLSFRAFNCTFNGVANWIFGNSGFVQGGRITGGLTAQCNTLGATEITGAYISGLCTFRGRAVGMFNNLIYHAGSYAVIDECTTFSEYLNNAASRNAGPGGAVVLKSGASSLTDGGNVFADGSTYPFFEITGGNRPNRGQTDDELRNLLHVSGATTLTPAQVGGQRKTTVVKDDGTTSLTLPALNVVEPGCTLVIKDAGNATGSPWSVVGSIDGGLSYPMTTDFQAVTFQADQDDNVWRVISTYL